MKAVKILEYLGTQPQGQGTSEIARQTQMNKTTVFKLLETLQLIGFVEKSLHDSRYKLGFGFIKIAHNSLQSLDIVNLTAPFLDKLNKETDETVHLAVLSEESLIYVAKLESTQAVRTISRIGRTAPLYCTGMGKAMLSTFSSEALEQYFNDTKLEQYTASTITDKQLLIAEIKKIKEQGYAIDNSEHEDDIRCIAVPLAAKGHLYGAVSLSAPKYRMDDAVVNSYLPLVIGAQKNIQERLAVAF
ncbi:IclR family transcriptional regulator [Anaerospora sp.]|uniref:IclR family transcriptional regulator n=1 Tax=Anaerospora sp. TaxID=1960278 RepID=UPI0028A18581|nr:IclR family transcriptional regulator [Anaerospora sp.]